MKKTLLLLLALFLTACSPPTPETQSPIGPEEDKTDEAIDLEKPAIKAFFSGDLANVDPNFNFSANLAQNWEVEYISGSQSINIYDPDAPGSSNLEKSQIFIKYFNASQFLTLRTVTIHSRTETSINERPTVIYDIEKKSGAANFKSQPTWRNQRHIVTDIRSTDESPTTFYVFAKSPNLSQNIFDDFINSLTFNPTKLHEPIENYLEKVTKKSFGTYVTPTNSPVQPERFTGYHTAIDVEGNTEEEDTTVFAIAEGTITMKSTVDGYGGVLLIEHTIDNKTVTAIYGHLRFSSIDKSEGDEVRAGEQIALLGTGYSTETGGERKHLHFGLISGSSKNLKGYVQNKADLDGWLDPIVYLQKH